MADERDVTLKISIGRKGETKVCMKMEARSLTRGSRLKGSVRSVVEERTS